MEWKSNRILARNVLILFAILEDRAESSRPLIWEIYYHIFLSTPASTLLRKLAESLLVMTESLDRWHNSIHGSRIRLVNQDTLSQLRSFWLRYCTEAIPGKADVQASMEKFRKTKSDGYVVTSTRSAAPLFVQALSVAPILHRHYWEKGVIWGDGREATHTNPTMIITEVRGVKFAMHYGTEPALPFHLSPAFAELSSGDPLYRPSLGVSCSDGERASRIADIVKSQFWAWSSSFQRRAADQTPSVCVRFVIGDALNLCRVLAEREGAICSPPPYARQWTFSPLLLDGGDYVDKGQANMCPGPKNFNVIDTSNLTDHVGLLNLLISTVPCLQKRPSATLFTESLLNRKAEADQVETFDNLLLADQTTMFLLFGVAPISYLTGVSLQSTAMDSIRGMLGMTNQTKGQFQRRAGWKSLHLGEFSNRRLQMTAKDLANFLFAIYLRMFSVEGVSQDLSISKLSKLAVIHYTRSSFAELVLFLSSKIDVNWSVTIDLLFDRIIADHSLLVGTSSIQDLYVQFYLRGLHIASSLTSAPREIPHNLPPLRESGPGILAQHSVGPIVSVNLVVPRKAIDVLTNLDDAIIGTPALRAEISGIGWQNFFSSIQMSFGRVVACSVASIDFQYDPQGWRGRNNMMVSFLAPAWMLLLGSEDFIKISLDIQSTPGTTPLVSKFGILLNVFEATLGDRDHVFITAQPPGIILPITPIASNSVHVQTEGAYKWTTKGVSILGPQILLHSHYKTVATMKFRLDVEEDSLKAKLAFKTTAVEPIQSDPCSILLKFGGWDQPLVFPFPVNVASCTVRISRKQSYMEVRGNTYSLSIWIMLTLLL